MATYEIEYGPYLKRMRKLFSQGGSARMEPLMNRIKNMLVSDMQGSFAAQSRGGVKWPERGSPEKSVKNLAGLLSDLSTGTNVKKRRFDERPALIDTGFLKKSIAGRIVSNNSVEVGTTAKYAQRQQSGLPDEIKITKTIKDNLNKWLKRKKNKRYSEELGWLFNEEEITVKPRPRVFVSLTKMNIDDIREMTRRFILPVNVKEQGVS